MYEELHPHSRPPDPSSVSVYRTPETSDRPLAHNTLTNLTLLHLIHEADDKRTDPCVPYSPGPPSQSVFADNTTRMREEDGSARQAIAEYPT